MNVLDLLAELGIQARKASNSKGGEYHSACPGCGGEDRFHVWPAQNNSTGSYWCRGCEKHGDNIQFLRDFAGLSFRDACRKVGREDLLDTDAAAPRQHRRSREALTIPAPAAESAPWEPVSCELPNATWLDQAAKMTEHCHQALLSKSSVLEYLAGRGIPEAAVIKHRLGWHEGQGGKDHRYSSYARWGLEAPVNDAGKPKSLWIPRGIVTPCFDSAGRVVRIRIRRPGEDAARFGNKYHILPGSSMQTMILGPPAAKAFVIVEAELDAIAVAHAAGELAGAIPVMTVEGKPDAEAAERLASSLCILNGLDIGDTGGGAVAAARARAWWRNHFPQAELWPVPAGKDPGEAAQHGEDLRLWVLAGLPAVFHVADPDHGGPSFVSGLVEGAAGNGKPTSIPANPGADPGPAFPEPALDSIVIEFKDGRRAFVTPDEAEYARLRDAGELVFSDDELTHLHVAVRAVGGGQDGEVLAMAALEVKAVFPGAKITRGGKCQ